MVVVGGDVEVGSFGHFQEVVRYLVGSCDVLEAEGWIFHGKLGSFKVWHICR